MSTSDTASQSTAAGAPPLREIPPTPKGDGAPTAKQRLGDRVFSGSALAAGTIILLVLAAVAFFLIVQSLPAFAPDTTENHILQGQSFFSYVGPLIFGTLWSALIALVLASPIAIGIALFTSHYAPRRVASTLGYVIDLLAAVPSVVFGLWGGLVLAPLAVPFYGWLNENLGWIPFFGGTVLSSGRSMMTAAIVLAVMIIPIMTAICREVFLQAPRLHEEAALALGATRWEMVRMAVLPFARSGIVSGAMLGLGRALGETMAVTMVLSATGVVTFDVLTASNPTPIPANIALRFPEAHDTGVNTLIATGLILFIVTFAVNALARWVVARRAAFSGAN